MAEENEIRVVITGVASDLRRALEGAKGDLGGLKAAIKDVPNQVKVDVNAATLEAAARLRSLQSQIGEIPDRISIDVSVDDGIANARLDLLNAKVRATERQIARAELGGAFARTAGGGGGGFGSTLLSNLGSGGLPGAGPLALGTAAAPLIAGGVGSITAVAGSAGAAALGAGAVGTAGLGTLLAGIGPLIALSGGLKDAIKLSGQLEQAQKNLSAAQQMYGGQNKQLTTAQNNYNAAVAAFGPSSNAARSAHAQLLLAQQKQVAIAPQILSAQHAITKLQLEANPAVLAFAKSWGEVDDAFKKAEQQVLPAFATALRPVLDTVTHLLPTLVQMARIDLRGISAGLKPLLDFVNSAGFKATLVQLSETFAKLAGPVGQAFTSLLRAFLSVAVAASPYLIQIAQAFERWAKSFADSLAPGQHLNALIRDLVGQLHSWWELATALGRIMVTVFKGGAELGKGLVDQLTHLLDKWNAWLHTTAGQAALHKFFTESLDLLRAVAGVLAPIAGLIGSMAVGLIPAMTTLLRPLAELLNTISHWINGLSKSLPPVLNALPGLAVAVGVLASWKALQAVVAATVAMMLRGVGLGGATAAAGAGGAGVTAAEVGVGAAGAGALYTALLPALAVALPAALVVALETGGPSKGKAQTGLASALGPLGASKTTGNILDRINPFGGSGLLGLGPAQISTQSAAVTKGLKAIADGLKGITDPAQVSKDKLAALRAEIARVSKMPDLTVTQRKGLGALADAFDPVNMAARNARRIWGSAFAGIDATTGSVMAQITQIVATQTKAITANLQKGSSQWVQAIAANYGGAIDELGRLNQAGVLSTANMVNDINKLLRGELKALGVTNLPAGLSNAQLGAVAAGVAVTGSTTAASSFAYGVGGSGGHAGGGLIQVGRPGERGSDSIPMNVGGVPIRVGAGEKVAVFNHQQQALARRLIPGGLDGLFAATRGSRHDMAGGGVVLDSGVNMTVGQEPSILNDLRALSTELQKTVFVISGYRSPSHSVSVGGFSNDPHTRGQAADIGVGSSSRSSMFGVAEAQLRGIGLYRPFYPPDPNEVNHVQLLAGANALGGARLNGPSLWQSIAAPKWTGPGGAFGQIGQAAAAKVLAAANAYGASKTSGLAAAFAGQGGGNAANEALGQKMMLAAGFPESDWPSLRALWTQESGWNANAVNPSSGAYGIPQSLGHGHPYNLGDAAGQIAWGLNYIRQRYGSPSGAEAHERAFNWYGAGGLIPGFAAGGHPVTHRAAKKPPAAPKHKHPKSTAPHAQFIPKDALKGLLTPSEMIPDKHAAGYARQATVLDERFSNLLAAQAANPVDDPELVTLSDADVKVLDPDGKLGYQAGDQIVNKDGMTVGRWFGPGGQILGGTFHRGATARLGQLAQILTNRGSRLTALRNEQGAQQAAVGVDDRQIKIREERKARIERYLHASVVRAGVVKGELDVLKSRNLAQALKDALSKRAIAGRLTGLRGHLRTVTDEIGAERRSQAGEAPLARDPTHLNELQAQAQGIRDSIAVETQLGASGSKAVEKAKSAIFAAGLRKQLVDLEKTNTTLGGKPLEAGTGGAIGTILSQVKTLSDDRDGRRNMLADFQLTQITPARAEIQSYLKEQADIGKLANIQVRTPDTAGAAAGGAAVGPDLAALNALLQTQLSQTQQALAISQAQFGVFQGFAPLLQGRLVGSFQSGIDFVPRTGVALVHRGETIIPDPAGPQGNRAAATVHTAQGPIEIVLNFQNNEPPLVKLVHAQMNQHSLQIVSDRSGQRARLMAGVRRP